MEHSFAYKIMRLLLAAALASAVGALVGAHYKCPMPEECVQSTCPDFVCEDTAHPDSIKTAAPSPLKKKTPLKKKKR